MDNKSIFTEATGGIDGRAVQPCTGASGERCHGELLNLLARAVCVDARCTEFLPALHRTLYTTEAANAAVHVNFAKHVCFS